MGIADAYRMDPPLVSDQAITNVQLNPKDPTNDEKTVYHDRRQRGRLQPKRVEPNVIG